MKKQIIRTIALTLAVFIMLCPLCVCFAAGTVIEELVINEIVELVWETLIGWGIQIGTEFISTTNQWLYTELQEYIYQELNQTWDAWITLIQFARDPWGRGIANNYFVETIWEFTEYLTNKYHWGSNDSYQIGATLSLNGCTVYELPLYMICNDTGSGTMQGWTSYWYEGTGKPYVIFYNNAANTIQPYVFSTGAFVCYVQNYQADGQASGSVRTTTVSATNRIYGTNTSNSDYASKALDHGVIFYKASNPEIEYYDYDTITTALKKHPIETTGGTPVTTYDIVLPGDDPNYEEGYSIIYYPDGSIGYLDINWPDAVSVDNLPAIVSTGSIRHLDLVSVFAPIKAFANTFSDSFDLMVQIIYNMPTEIVSIALTIMSAIAVFGTIKIFKEH